MSSKISRVESTASSVTSLSSKKTTEDKEARSIKCVVVGDGTVGKTSLLISYTSNRFPTEYVPTIFDNYTADVVIDGENHKLGLFDTAGEEDYDKLRPLSYPRTDVFIACFAVDSPDSFANIKLKWLPELRHYCPGTPILLVGTKADLRNDIATINRLRESNMEVVSSAEAQEAQKKMNCYYYCDCSSLTRVGVKHVFDQAIKAALKYRKQRTKRQCQIL